MKGYRQYFLTKLGWFLVTFVFAFLLNFILPRLMPGDPVAAITPDGSGHDQCDRCPSRLSNNIQSCLAPTNPSSNSFLSTSKMWHRAILATSFSQYPRTVGRHYQLSIWWTIVCISGDYCRLADREYAWRAGGLSQRGFDKVLMPISIFVSNLPGIWHGHYFTGGLCGQLEMVSDLRRLWV